MSTHQKQPQSGGCASTLLLISGTVLGLIILVLAIKNGGA